MPSERKESQMSKSFSKINNDIDGHRKEYLWGCDLSKEVAEHTWEFDEEDEDTDYLKHELLLKLAVLGKGVVDGERQIIVAETKDYKGKTLNLTIVNLVGGEGKFSMVSLEDLTFKGEVSVTFRLVEGDGPVHLSGQHGVDWPNEHGMLGDTVLEFTEDEEATETEEEKSKGSKRKLGAQAGGKKKQRGKLDSSNLSALSTGDDDEEEDDEEEDDDLNDEDLEDDEEMASDEDKEEDVEDSEEEEPESSPEKPKKGKGPVKGKAKAAPAKPAPKAAKGAAKKAGKKGKAK